MTCRKHDVTDWKLPLSVPSTTNIAWLENANVTDNLAGRLIEWLRDICGSNPSKFPAQWRRRDDMQRTLFGYVPALTLPDDLRGALVNIWARYVKWTERHPQCISEREALKVPNSNDVALDNLWRAWHGYRSNAAHVVLSKFEDEFLKRLKRADMHTRMNHFLHDPERQQHQRAICIKRIEEERAEIVRMSEEERARELEAEAKRRRQTVPPATHKARSRNSASFENYAS